ncbi:MAG: LPP20 family lipoprotein [Deltaproteobacteria bacterium]|nr:LPP20 family lipoprotein [Deltaproteobacteria bacterium]
MKTRTLVVVAVALMLAFPATEGFTAEWHQLVETVGTHGSINWSEGIITATGIGTPPEKYYGKPQARPMALRAAQLDAYRNLLEVTRGVRVDSTTVVRDSMVESDVIRSQVEGMVKGAQTVKKEYLSDGTVEVTVAMDLRGGFAQLILPKDIKQVPEIKTISPALPAPPMVGDAPVPPTPVPTTPTPAPTIFTGLVVDASGLNARPAMSPKIFDENEQEVYGSGYVSREFAVQQGMAGYARDMTAAQSNPRVTNEPFTVKGLRTEGPGRSNVVISNADAGKIRSASENLSFLKKCRVMIVLD